METFNRLAGVADPPPNSSIPDPPPIPQDIDIESQSQYTLSRRGSRASRVSLPLNRRPSHHSFRSRKSTDRVARPDHPEDVPPLPPFLAQQRHSADSAHSEDSGEETGHVWGPSHPCFPHPNPHCDPRGEEARTTRVIRVRRDWLVAGDLYPQYATVYPEILEPFVTHQDFIFLLSNINARLKTAFDPFTTRAGVDAVLGVATGFIWEDLGLTRCKAEVKKLDMFMEGWNREQERQGKEGRVVLLRQTGFTALDFVVPDPGIDIVPEGQMDPQRVENGTGIGPAL